MRLAPKLYCARWLVIQSNVLIAMCGFVLLALGVWTVNDKLFVDELLRNKLYTETTFIIIVTSNLMILLSAFGCFAAVKEVKCLLLTYAVFMLLLFVILSVGGVLAYIFREQVENTIQAEMIADIRNYDPGEPENSVTRAWDETQSKLECCGLMTEQVSQAWQMWRYNKLLNPGPDSQLVPASCCLPNLECRQDNATIVDNIWQGDCMTISIQYVRQHAAILGIANVSVCFFLDESKRILIIEKNKKKGGDGSPGEEGEEAGESENQDPTDAVPEKCTEKLVDLVFVLATKLDLNVNDMRELLDNSMKENCQKFEDLTRKLKLEVDQLSEKISLLEEENRGQTERILSLETESSRAKAEHNKLETEFNSLSEDYNSLVVQQYGDRLSSLEGGHQDLHSKLNSQNKDNIDKFADTVVRMESLEMGLLKKMEDTEKFQTAAWNKKDEENKAGLALSLAGLTARLEEDDRRLTHLSDCMETDTIKSREYQLNNDQKLKSFNDILMSNTEDTRKLQQDYSSNKSFIENLNSKFLEKMEEINNKIHKIDQTQLNLDREISITNDKVSDNDQTLKSELSEVSGKHQKLKHLFDNHKSQVENQNRQNAEEHENIECTLQLLRESKNSLEKDLEFVKTEIRTNENSRKYQELENEQKISLVSENQKSHGEVLTKVETDIRILEEKQKLDKKYFLDEFRKTDIKFQDSEGDIKLKMKSFRDQLDKDQSDLHSQVRADMGEIQDSVSYRMEELRSKVNTLINCDIASSTKEISGFRNTIDTMLSKVSEITTQVGEMNRSRENNLLIHGLPIQEEESLDCLVKLVSDLVRTRLGVGRELSLLEVARLGVTRVELGGWPPVLLSFEHTYDRDAVLSRAGCLDRSGIMITEDMTRPDREMWGELRKFMVRVKTKYPTSQCFLKKTTLFVDTRMFVWSLEEGRVMEQAVISIPTPQTVTMPRLNVQNRCPTKLRLEELRTEEETNE